MGDRNAQRVGLRSVGAVVQPADPHAAGPRRSPAAPETRDGIDVGGAQEFFVDWEKAAKDLVAALRSMAGRNPYDRALSELVGELSTRSDAFRTWWAAHNVRYHQTGTKRLHHPVVGDLELSYDVMELAADTGLRLAIFTAEPGSRSDEALNLLASWVATPEHEPVAPARNDVPRR